MNRLPWPAVLLTAVCVSCATSDERGSYAPVDASGWLYSDTLRLAFEPADSDSLIEGRLAVTVRHSADYAYSNIWLEVSYPPCDSLIPDTLNIRLADSYGNWFGKGLGLSFQLCDSTARHISLKAPATVNVRHIMRVDRLEDIEQVGVVIIPD